MPALAKCRAGNPLVCVRGLLDDHLLMAALSTAAAHADEPEEAGANGEGDGEPEDGEHLAAHGGTDVVGFEDGLENTGDGAVDCGCGCGGEDGEDGLCLCGVRARLARRKEKKDSR